ncbi:VOC family protein [Gemmatimonadota bacterium]
MRHPRFPIPALFLLGLFSSLVSACGTSDQRSEAPSDQRPEGPPVQIDHVIVAAADLQTGMDQFEALTGVRPAFGGEHPGRGTRNALVSLGPRLYLELLAPQEDAELPEDVAGLSDLPGLSAWGWAASTADMDGTLSQIRDGGYTAPPPEPGSRAMPDGRLLRWRAGGAEEPVILGAPFFIEWDPGSPHPATTSPQGCELGVLKVISPDAEELRSYVDLLGLAVEVEATADAVERYEVTLRCPAGNVVFR